MKPTISAVAITLLAIILMAGCAPAPVSPAPAADEAQALPRTMRVKFSLMNFSWTACKTYMDVDLREAYDRFDGPVFWTFHTNFLDPVGTDVRLGCLRFYWRDNVHEVFTGTLKSAVLVECKVVANDGTDPDPVLVTEKLEAAIASSDLKRAPGDPSLPQRKAVFSGDAHLECLLDINNALNTVAQSVGFLEDLQFLEDTRTLRM